VKGINIGRYTLCKMAATAMLAACSTSAVPATGAHAAPPATRRASSGALLYVVGGGVYVISYPQGALVNTITGIDEPQGVCSDKNGNVFVTAYRTENVLEYAHGGSSPIANLGDYGYYPLGCAVDPTTGNLAVANQQSFNESGGNVAIYAKAQGKPTFWDREFGLVHV
jgi:DNA-binding beta-propeller fold protein YncE